MLLEEIVNGDNGLGMLPVQSGSEQVEKNQAQGDKAIHCLKVINGELFLLCNIRTRSEFINQNLPSFESASCIEVNMPIPGV